MAEALTNYGAKAQGLDLRAWSAGTVGGKDLNPIAVQAMEEIGISMAGQAPKQLTQEIVDEADRIILMGCGVDTTACPARFMLTEDWDLEDPAGKPIDAVREIRNQIKHKVDELLAGWGSE